MKFSFTGKDNLVSDLQQATDTFCQKEEIDMPIAMKLQLIMEELALNVVHHGSEGKECTIELVLEWNEPILNISFRDNGKQFDPLSVPPPDINADLENRPVGGLGLFLVKEMTSKLTYRYENGFNRLDMSIDCGIA